MAKIEKLNNDELIDYQWLTSEDMPVSYEPKEPKDTGPGCAMSVILLVVAVPVLGSIGLGIGWIIIKLVEFWAMRGVL